MNMSVLLVGSASTNPVLFTAAILLMLASPVGLLGRGPLHPAAARRAVESRPDASPGT
ncbi:MAG: hypothetical protein M3Y58_19720 [Chloroflexota bacterium]|nr:hypothetical protein [Chloroflexota bacterium]